MRRERLPSYLERPRFCGIVFFFVVIERNHMRDRVEAQRYCGFGISTVLLVLKERHGEMTAPSVALIGIEHYLTLILGPTTT